jgi:hypothetical protein
LRTGERDRGGERVRTFAVIKDGKTWFHLKITLSYQVGVLEVGKETFGGFMGFEDYGP